MLAEARQAEGCRWRGPDDPDSSATCLLVERLAPPGLETEHRVSRATCSACCRGAEPAADSPGEVVASVVHGLLQARLADRVDATTFVQTSEQLAWIEQFLRVDDADDRPIADTRAPAEPPRRARARGRGLRRWLRRTPRVGLVGTNDLKGLGHINRDLIRWLEIEDWLLPGSRAEVNPAAGLAARVEHAGDAWASSPGVGRFLDRIDILLFVEDPHVHGLTRQARRRGVRTVCVPNWEWLHPGLDWLHDVDLMLCPTRLTKRILEGWKDRFGFAWETGLCPWPIDVSAIPFRLRTKCRRFVTINGAPSDARRKGLDVLMGAARRLPDVPFLVWSQTDALPPVPPNVEVRRSAAENRRLYDEGDVCVQLSRWEGLGLPLLECQAAGLPLITTDAPPMNEHNPLAVLPSTGRDVVELWHRRPIVVPRIRREDAAAVLGSWFGRDLAPASRAAREFVEREHSWARSRDAIRSAIANCPRSRP